MTRARFVLSTLVAALVVAALVLAGSAAAGISFPPMPPGWSHGEINVTIKGKPHTLIVDRGRVLSASESAIVLREQDGSVVNVPVGAKTRVRLPRGNGTVFDIRRGMVVQTLRVDGGEAQLVKVVAQGRRP